MPSIGSDMMVVVEGYSNWVRCVAELIHLGQFAYEFFYPDPQRRMCLFLFFFFSILYYIRC